MFGESDPATVQLVTDSVFESATFRIQGLPSQIPLTLYGSLHPNRLPSLSVCGQRVPGRGRIMDCQMYLNRICELV